MIQPYNISSTTFSLFILLAYSVYRIAQRQKMMECQNVNNSYHALAMRKVSVNPTSLYVNKYLKIYISYHSAAASFYPMYVLTIRSTNGCGDDISRLRQGFKISVREFTNQSMISPITGLLWSWFSHSDWWTASSLPIQTVHPRNLSISTVKSLI